MAAVGKMDRDEGNDLSLCMLLEYSSYFSKMIKLLS